ncbi:MAG: hypothetical protein ABIJ31_11435 [Pseudomonadota bacterium]
MDPDQFREIRVKISQLCDNIITLAENNDAQTSKNKLSQANVLLDGLTPQAEGEIQQRSVKNLGLKCNALSAMIDKIKVTKKAAPDSNIDWNEAYLSSLPGNYLSKVFANMGSDKTCRVCFSTAGSGIKASYQIDFGDGKCPAFSGSSHKELKRTLLQSSQKVSQPFSLSTIESIINKKV